MTTTHHRISALTTAIEARDTAGILAWYADDATMTILDRDHPPAAPSVHTGAAAIGEFFSDVCGRNVEHEVRDLVATDAGLAFTQHCRYPDGERVVCATIATLHDGKIKTQTAVQVWDS
jgi:ketosteroid isomerase-like protein